MGNFEFPVGIRKLSAMVCGCGCPSEVYDVAKRLLEYFGRDIVERGEFGDGDWLAVYILDHCGLIEHGSSVCGSWLTDDGKEVLEFLGEHGSRWTDLPGADHFMGRWVWEAE